MRFYRVHYRDEGSASLGFTWHTSRRKADRAVRQAAKNNPHHEPAEVQEFELDRSKEGILLALNSFADHPDNG